MVVDTFRAWEPHRTDYAVFTIRPFQGFCDKIPINRGDSNAHRLLYVGQLIERKGLLPFTQALARWASAHPERKVEFVLAGYGPLRGRHWNRCPVRGTWNS